MKKKVLQDLPMRSKELMDSSLTTLLINMIKRLKFYNRRKRRDLKRRRLFRRKKKQI